MGVKRFLFFLVIFIVLLPVVISVVVSFYSQGVSEITLPDLTGLTTIEAVSMLETLNLKARVVGGIFDKSIPEGKVASQRPEAGRHVKEGRLINLIVSKGARTVLVPNLVGRDFESAKQYLGELGLSIGMKIEEPNSSYKFGVVLEQYPSAQTEVKLGSPVDLTINSSEREQ